MQEFLDQGLLAELAESLFFYIIFICKIAPGAVNFIFLLALVITVTLCSG
jgi:hypothetical protein